MYIYILYYIYIFFYYIYSYIIYIYIYLFHRHVFRPSQDSSVWLGLTSREKLKAPQCSMKKFRAYILYMYMYMYIYIYIKQKWAKY